MALLAVVPNFTKLLQSSKILYRELAGKIFFALYTLIMIPVSEDSPIFVQKNSSIRKKHHQPKLKVFLMKLFDLNQT